MLPDAVTDCGVGMLVWSVVIAYNADTVGKAPATLADFWDTKTWTGKRGMRKGPKLNLEYALMADGVEPADVYKVLNTPEGVDRAFAKLDEIKPLVQWWEAGAQAPEWLAAGDVELSVAYNGRITNAQKDGKNLQMIWDRTIFAIDSWAIIEGAPNQDAGYAFIKYTTDPGRQAAFTKAYAYGPTHKNGVAMVDPERAKSLPAGDNLATGLFGGSQEALDFWVDYQEELTERWNRWVRRIEPVAVDTGRVVYSPPARSFAGEGPKAALSPDFSPGLSWAGVLSVCGVFGVVRLFLAADGARVSFAPEALWRPGYASWLLTGRLS